MIGTMDHSATTHATGARADDIVGPRSERERRRFEAYCRWSMHVILLGAGVVAAAGSLSAGRAGVRAHGWSPETGLLIGAVSAGVAIVWTALAIALTELLCTERPVPPVVVRSFAVISVIGMVGQAALVPSTGIREQGAGPFIGLGPAILIGTAAVAALTKRWRLVLAGTVIGLIVLYLVYVVGPPGLSTPAAAAVMVMTTWLCIVVVPTAMATRWMIDVVRRLWRSRQVAADLAVAEERLRFSRDLHDVFGRTLSTVAVKSELAAELARRGDDRAAEEMMAVREIAQSALTDVRGLVRGYRRIQLDDEVIGARSVLRAAGIRTRVLGLDDPEAVAARLSDPAAEALAWVVREGVTNVLRHGQAGEVRITVDEAPDHVVLTIENTSLNAVTRTPGGTGLIGLRERVEAVGGSLEAGPSESGFALVARVPLH